MIEINLYVCYLYFTFTPNTFLMFLKRTLTFLMLVAVLNQTFNTVSTLVAFQMNRQYIAEMLCVNKNRPEMNCNGKCVLMQRVQSEVDKAQAKGQQMLQNLIEHEVVLFFENWDFNLESEQNLPNFRCHSIITMSDQCRHQFYLSDIFHPPLLG